MEMQISTLTNGHLIEEVIEWGSFSKALKPDIQIQEMIMEGNMSV